MNHTVLDNIIADKRTWLTTRQQQQPLANFVDDLQPSDRDFYQALEQQQTVFILECKKASPSNGLIRADFDLTAIANVYKTYAAVISVLTDEKYFQGNFNFLPIVRQQVTQPILCKDFIIDDYQVYLARHYHADAILLMLSVLNDAQYNQLANTAHQLKMGVLTEVSTEQELQRAININAKIIGINNRNLRDLSITLERTKQFAPKIPNDRIIISESGIYTHQQVMELSHYADGFLVGSALMKAPDLDLAVRRLLLGENKVCGLTREQDALAAYQAGAVYGGLIFAPDSPRYISPEKAATLITRVPLKWVAVFRNNPLEQIIKIANDLTPAAIQLHGKYENQLSQLREQLPQHCRIWLAVDASFSLPLEKPLLVDRFVFDNGNGGSGHHFDWQALKQNKIRLTDILLAGGINNQNITDAMQIGCLGVDINSGAESAPGIKSIEKIIQLFTLLRNY